MQVIYLMDNIFFFRIFYWIQVLCLSHIYVFIYNLNSSRKCFLLLWGAIQQRQHITWNYAFYSSFWFHFTWMDTNLQTSNKLTIQIDENASLNQQRNTKSVSQPVILKWWNFLFKILTDFNWNNKHICSLMASWKSSHIIIKYREYILLVFLSLLE